MYRNAIKFSKGTVWKNENSVPQSAELLRLNLRTVFEASFFCRRRLCFCYAAVENDDLVNVFFNAKKVFCKTVITLQYFGKVQKLQCRLVVEMGLCVCF